MKIIKIFSIIILPLFLLILVSKIEAVNSYHESPYFNGSDKVEIASDSGFQNHTLVFNKGDNVYIRISTERFKNLILVNNLRLRNYVGGILATSSLTQKTFTTPYVFEGSITIPSSITDYVYLDLDFQWGRISGGTIIEGKLGVSQALDIQGIDQYFKYYKDGNYNEEKYAFRSNGTIYVKVWGTGQNVKSAQFSIKKLDGIKNIYSIPAATVTRDGNWYKFSFNLSSYSGSDGWAYMGEVYIRDTNNVNISFNNKFFIIDNTLPSSVITYPVANSVLSRQVSIIGTATDNNFRQYQLYIEDMAIPGVWNALSSSITTPVQNTRLFDWDTTSYVGKTVNLKLVTTDWAGNENSSVISNIKIDGILTFSIPEACSFSNINSSSYVQTSVGYIGEGTGNNDVRIQDSRVDKPGWAVTVKFTHFNFDEIQIPVTNLTVIPDDFHVVSGSGTGVEKGQPHTFTGENDSAVLIRALSGNGTGIYWQRERLELTIPANGVAGQYTSTATITIQ